MILKRPFLGLVCLLWCFCSEPAQAGNRYALLIGNGEKYGTRIGPLKTPPNDVEAIRQALISVGFEPNDIRVVLDADLGKLNKERREFGYRLQAAGEGVLGFFYYSGHGAANKLDGAARAANYLIPVDVTDTQGAREIFASSLPLSNVISELRRAAYAADLIVVFDACRNEFRASTDVDSKTFLSETLPRTGNTFLGFSTDATSVAYDQSDGAGPFARALADEIVKPNLTHEQVFFGVRDAVLRATRTKRPPQKPSWLDGFVSRLYFVKAPTAQNEDELKDWNEALRSDTIAGYEEFVKKRPESVHAREGLARRDLLREDADWRITKAQNTREAFENFLDTYPSGRYSETAYDHIAAIDRAVANREWRSARNSRDLRQIEAVIGKYPEAAWQEEARALARELRQLSAENQARTPDTPSSLPSPLPAAPIPVGSPTAEVPSMSEREPKRLAAARTSESSTRTKGLSDELFATPKQIELRNLFFPKGTFSNFFRGKIADRINLSSAQPIRRLLLTNDLTRLYSGGDDGAVRIWDLKGVDNTKTLEPQHAGKIYAVARSDNSRYLATGSFDRTVYLWDEQTDKISQRIPVRPVIYSMTFSPTGRWIAAAGSDGQVDFIRVRDRRVNRRHISPPRTIFAVAYLPNKSEDLIVGDASGALRLWSVIRGREKYVPHAHSGKILTLSVNPKGDIVASGDTNGVLKWWSSTLGELRAVPNIHRGRITALRFSPDGRLLASGGEDGSVRLWDHQSGKQFGRTLSGHKGDVEGIEFSPDGNYLFSSSEDRTVRIWDVAESRLLYTLIAFPGGEYLIFDPQQRYLASENVRARLKN